MSVLRSLSELASIVRDRVPRITVHGCDGALFATVIARVAEEIPTKERPLVVVVPDETQAEGLVRDVRFFLGSSHPVTESGEAHGDDPTTPPRVLHLPSGHASPYAELSPDRRAIMRRLATLFRLSQWVAGDVLIASASALLRRVITRAELGKLSDIVLPEQELDREALISLCARAGYTRSPVVEDPGTFAVRGGVVDLFPPLYRFPARIELFGDIVESIRFFDPQTQRTMRVLDELYVHPVRETVRTSGADPRAKILAAADAASHPSTKTRAILEQVEAGEDFFGIETLTPAFHARMSAIDEYLPKEALWVLLDPEAVREAVADELADAEERFSTRRAENRLALEPQEHYLGQDELAAMLARAPSMIEARPLELHDPSNGTPAIRFESHSNRALVQELSRARAEKADELLKPLVTALRDAREEGFRVGLVSPNIAHGERLKALLKGYSVEVELRRSPGAEGLLDLPPAGKPTIFLGPLCEGFRLTTDRLLLVTEEEIFGQRSHARRTPESKKTAKVFGSGVENFSDLKPGDFVVHATNGVGLYKGLTKLPLPKGIAVDFLHIEYEGGSLYLPVYRLSEVTRYVGAEGHKPRLDRLGGVTWEKTKKRVSAEVKKLAEDLLQLYAQRKALPGHAFPPPDEVFREFEATFPFEETPDQQKAIDDVLADMEEPRPMDRLVCGDVGYGKTEVALRATLKAVLGGKQVAILAPTTVLALQHGNTFRERLKGWPLRLDTLSRFTPRADQAEILKKLGEGQLDVVIGTHRLLSNDVRFKDLGLIVVDEEQRFGVAHKERLKRLRSQVDVLTLTATPIPRTLHMALMGLREVSIIATPPVDRLAIRTFACRPDDDIIREGMRRELARGGQVFFVCHRIGEEANPSKNAGDASPPSRRAVRAQGERSLSEWVQHIRELVPDARVAMAHGQMDPDSLEKVMVDFVDGRYDVLCCTTIIESGLDIGRANTMFVNRADAFGLAQLYQLRGRIGRSRERAYCYLMIPPESTLTDEAKQRLQVLQRFTELGAGFQVATHDLEIRGAGDLLGAQQSGEIAAVGFDTYTKILEEAVAELRGEAIRKERDPELNVDLPGYIPDEYVPDTGQRLDLYKRLSAATGEDEVQEVLEEISDRYGALPEEVKLLGELMIVKAYGRRLGAQSIELAEQRLVLALDSQVTPLKPEKVLALINKPKSPYRLTPDMRLVRTFTGGEHGDRIRAAKRCLLELMDCAN
ncbi:MAG: transcription-repair coupling factor [Deltaproteobacteria bacterium]|nr:transcription-repair coupling factor [Deltaproteobacteria bacterium]